MIRTKEIYKQTTNKQYKQTTIDDLRIRDYVSPKKAYYDKVSIGKSKHIKSNDYYDNSKQLVSFNMHKLGSKDTPTNYVYYNGGMIKLSKLLTILKRQHKQFMVNTNMYLLVNDNNTIATYEIKTLSHRELDRLTTAI